MAARKTEKFSKLSDFDKGQIVMAIRLGLDISEAAALVECPRAVLVPVYKKWAGLDLNVDQELENGEQPGTEAEERPGDPAPEKAAKRRLDDEGSAEGVSPAAPEQSDPEMMQEEEKKKKSKKGKKMKKESSEGRIADTSSPRPDSSELLSGE
ncbi:uncharacterized protein ACB058_003097 [Synchiropus picturatus]